MDSYSEYLNSKSLEEITTEDVLSIFTLKGDSEHQLYPQHLLLNVSKSEKDIDKVCKMLEIFFQNGRNPNEKGFAEYSFLHLALYGGEIDGNLIPYKLSLFERIIPLAKQYGLDVNCRDEDGDTLIHTAIYSEDYFDKIEPLIRLLGPDFDITARNNEGETILDALKNSIIEAKEIQNREWLRKLEMEKDILTEIMKLSSNPAFVIPEYSQEKVTASNYLNINYFKDITLKTIEVLIPNFEEKELNELTMEQTKKKIKKLKASILNSGLTEEEKEEFLRKINDKEEEIIVKLKQKIEDKLLTLNSNSELEECEKTQIMIENSHLPEPMIEEFKIRIITLIEKVKQQLLITELKNSIQNIKTIQDIETCMNQASRINDQNLRQEIEIELRQQLEEARREIENTKAMFHSIRNLLTLSRTYFKTDDFSSEGILDGLDLENISDETIEKGELETLTLYQQTLSNFSEKIILTLEENLRIAIREELKKAEIIDSNSDVKTSLVNVLLTEFSHILEEKGNNYSINPENLPKQKEKKNN